MKTRFIHKRSQRKPGKRNLLFLFAGIVALGLLATLYIWQRMETVRLAREIGFLEKQIAEIGKTKEYLSIQVAHLGSPGQLCQVAQKDLGFGTTDIGRQIAFFDPVQNPSPKQWQKLLADVRQYGKKAWNLAEPEAMAKMKNE